MLRGGRADGQTAARGRPGQPLSRYTAALCFASLCFAFSGAADDAVPSSTNSFSLCAAPCPPGRVAVQALDQKSGMINIRADDDQAPDEVLAQFSLEQQVCPRGGGGRGGGGVGTGGGGAGS